MFLGSRRGCDILDKVTSLLGASSAAPPPHRDVIEWLYRALNVLDAKASALLRVNSLFIALLSAVMIGLMEKRITDPVLLQYRFLVWIPLVLYLISSAFCFMIVRVNWKFLGQVTKKSAGTGYDFGPELNRIANVLDDRTHFYWIAWWSTVLAMLGVVLSALAAVSRP